MWRDHTPDPTVCSGYAGFFNYLLLLPVGIGWTLGGINGAFVAGRAFVAATSVASVALAFAYCRRKAGVPAAWLAAALMTFSRVEIRESHQISPDVIITACAWIMLLIVDRESARRRDDFVGGALVGMAVATKYTGLLLLPVLWTTLGIGQRLKRRALLTLLAAGIAFCVAAPYAVMVALGKEARFGMGFSHPIAAYYGDGLGENRLLSTGALALSNIVLALTHNLGSVACALALAGVVMFRPWRALAPTLSLFVVSAGVLAAANYFHPRHGELMSSAFAALAAFGLAWLHRVSPGRVVLPVALVVVLASPAWSALEFARRYAAGEPAEQAKCWLESSSYNKTAVVTSLAYFQVDRQRFEALRVDAITELPAAGLASFALIVTSTADERQALLPSADLVRQFSPNVAIMKPRASAIWEAVPPPARVDASASRETARAAWDGDRETAWIIAQTGWIQAEWDAPVAIDAVEIDTRPGLWPPPSKIEARAIDGRWVQPAAVPLRPRLRESQRRDSRPTQFYLLNARIMTRALRVAVSGQPRRWGAVEIRPFALASLSRKND
ncbi:MAG: glycosyltransferase family 39 protein [Vicinamibacteria bacterium]|nr:glycosyltransferase family 39 protein [Vicinamibacteria bacterium]